ncbi:hypothetical protein AQS8620_02114 [Aquimixticola soesokkakensis]|uniref:DUF4174 domain-containing protein n=1 Tax=Aquimixticola soesokkakensis TaxID=1519096 RepID=A0A1Y5SVU6_9RHOB|nr:DUF4174 domain-containing protein [Aquimixticola soesokkakensis]SLN49499.1 hypothetical protein AQS8620_02114 [Aquimixticola soesokkakensis]
MFKSLLLAVAVITAPLAVDAQEAILPETLDVFDGTQVALDDLKWVARPVVVFADSPLDPSFTEQLALLAARPDALAARDVVVIADTDPDERSELRTKLRPRGFALVVIDKDAQVMLRKPTPWDVREITRAIDKTPLRQQEIRDGTGGLLEVRALELARYAARIEQLGE